MKMLKQAQVRCFKNQEFVEKKIMGFFKWLYEQYKTYELEQACSSIEPEREEKEKIFRMNYARCKELGFSEEAILALMNLWSSM